MRQLLKEETYKKFHFPISQWYASWAHIEINYMAVCFLELIWLVIYCSGIYLVVGVEHFSYNVIVFFTLGYFINDIVAAANKWRYKDKCIVKKIEVCLVQPHQPNFW